MDKISEQRYISPQADKSLPWKNAVQIVLHLEQRYRVLKLQVDKILVFRSTMLLSITFLGRETILEFFFSTRKRWPLDTCQEIPISNFSINKVLDNVATGDAPNSRSSSDGHWRLSAPPLHHLLWGSKTYHYYLFHLTYFEVSKNTFIFPCSGF